jgi:hypothetical protein
LTVFALCQEEDAIVASVLSEMGLEVASSVSGSYNLDELPLLVDFAWCNHGGGGVPACLGANWSDSNGC